MNNKIAPVIIVLILVFILTATYINMNVTKNGSLQPSGISQNNMSTTLAPTSSIIATSTPNSTANPTPSKGSYENYTPEKVANSNGKTVLFFYADWCPTCNALDKNIQSQLEKIPNDVTILKVNYDKERDLIKKYGVTYQHTLVWVKNNGDSIKKWSGSYTIDEILSKLN